MAKKDTKERKIRKTNGSFEMVGRIKINEKTFSNDTSANGYVWERVSTSINTGNGNTPFINCMGGYNPDKPLPIRIYQNGESFDVDWEDRNNEEIIDKISKYNKIVVGVSRDDEDKVVYNEYLSWYDAVEELKENKEELDGAVVKVRGNIGWNEYNDNINPQFNITSIYLVDKEEEDFHSTYKQIILMDVDGIEKPILKILKETNFEALPDEVEISAYMMDYNSSIKKTRPYKSTYVLKKSDFKNIKQFGKILKLLYIGKNKILMTEVVGNVVNSQNIRNATLEDFDADVLDFYDGDEDELMEEKIIESGGNARYLSITKPAFRFDKETGKKGFYRHITGEEDFPYELSDLVFVNEVEAVNDIDEMLDDEDFDIDIDFD